MYVCEFSKVNAAVTKKRIERPSNKSWEYQDSIQRIYVAKGTHDLFNLSLPFLYASLVCVLL